MLSNYNQPNMNSTLATLPLTGYTKFSRDNLHYSEQITTQPHNARMITIHWFYTQCIFIDRFFHQSFVTYWVF